MEKPRIPSGTRDFSPDQMYIRNYIFETIKNIFQRYGFQPLETPSMETLSVLTGKYGDEGDQLLYKVLNSGDYLSKASPEDFQQGSKSLTAKIAEKGLRYDLTVPFARYVVMNQHNITFPFKRYQIQPVWRADRAQKGRYREFYQCDADIIGTESILSESEIILMINDVFDALRLQDYKILVNNRKVLMGIVEKIGAEGKETAFCVAIDKLDKIGKEKVIQELESKGFSNNNLTTIDPIFNPFESNEAALDFLTAYLQGSTIGEQGVQELQKLIAYTSASGRSDLKFNIDVTLARGLSYYTGTIFEVKPTSVRLGSICGGGRYDDLTGVFGLKDMSGVGISFGIERIYDVLEELDLFPKANVSAVQLMIVNFGEDTVSHSIQILQQLRDQGINSELYPDAGKMKKQLNYANKRGIPFVLMIGSTEIETEVYSLKNMQTGEQQKLGLSEIIGLFNTK